MNVTAETVDLPQLRLRVLRPVGAGRWPVALAFPDIFQHTPPHLRLCTRLAAHGFTVVTPELYGRFEPPGTWLRFEEDRQRALDDSGKLALAWLDQDLAAALGYAGSLGDRLLACGWCFGGHLAFRAALDPRVEATACFYATGLHTDSLGAAAGTARSLAEAGRIRGRLLMTWGSRDPHIPAEGRQRIHRALAEAGTAFEVRLHDAEHAFMRDEGPRWEPRAADLAFADLLRHFGAGGS